MSRYLIYDVETPNRHNNAICACAWLLLDGEEAAGRGYTLINPEAEFDNFNIGIHSIHPEDVAAAPTLAEYWKDTLGKLFDGSVIVAHNASFDVSVTSKALDFYGIEMPRVHFIDTLAVFRNLLPGQSCKLPDLAKRYSIGYKAHDAGADVWALHAVLDLVRDELEFNSYAEMFEAASICPTSAASEKEKSLQKAYGTAADALLDCARSKQVDLTDVAFSFHGEMQTLPVFRTDGLDKIITDLGGIFLSGVSSKTDYFVCFDDRVSGSVKKARELSEKPESHIQIIDESAFLDILGYRTANVNMEGPQVIRDRKQAARLAAIEAAKEKERIKAEKAAARAVNKTEANSSAATKKIGRSVIQMDKDGNIVAEYETITLAAANVGASTKVIRDCATGKQRTAAGFVWKYADTDTEASP